MTAPMKTKSTNFSESVLSLAAIACSTVVGSQIAAAQTTTSEIRLSSSAAYDSNPFLGIGNDTEVASFRLEMVPTIEHRDGVSAFKITAKAEHIEYSKRYDSVQNLAIELDARTQVNERIDVSTRLSAASLISNTSNSGLQAVIDPVDPQVPFPPVIDDITLFGTQQRRTTGSARTIVNYRLGQFDFLRLASGFDLQRTDRNTGFGNSDYISTSLTYNRQLNEQLSVGGMFEVSAGNFKYVQFGDSRTLSPQVVVNARIDSRWNAAGSFGVSFTRVELPTGQLNSTAFSGSGSLCYNDGRSAFCANGQRQLLPSAFGGLRRQLSIGTTYSTRLSSRDTLQTGTSIAEASTPLTGGFQKVKSVRVFGRYERRISEQLSAFASVAFDDSSAQFNSRKPNYQATLGISYRFGKIR